MRKALLLLAMILGMALNVHAQAGYTISPPVPNGTLYVCVYNSSQAPTFPCANLAVVYTSSALSAQLSLPDAMGAGGTATFYGKPGFYWVQISVSGSMVQQFVISLNGGLPQPGTVTSGGVSPGQITSTYNVSSNCGGGLNCTAINADGNMITDGTSNSSTTVTCPNSDCNFTAADVGKTFWATTKGSGSFGQYIYTTVVCPVTTIATIVSAQSVTLSNTCTANATANAVFWWGHKDGTAISSGVNAAGCAVINFPSGVIFDDQPWGNTATTSANCHLQPLVAAFATPLPLVVGQPDSTMIVITPDFNYAGCTGTGAVNPVCIGSVLGGMDYFIFVGTGLTAAANANCPSSAKTFLALNPSGGSFLSVNLGGMCPGAPGEGVEMNSLDQYWWEGGAQEAFTDACVGNSLSSQTYQLDCLNDSVGSTGIGWLQKTGINQDLGSKFIESLSVASGATYGSHMTHLFGASGGTPPAENISGTWNSDTDFSGADFSQTFNNLIIQSGGLVASRNTTHVNNTASPSGNVIGNLGTFIDQGGNTATGPGGVDASATASWRGLQIITEGCSGTVTSATTVALFQTSQACTTAIAGVPGIYMSSSGTLWGLKCNAGTAGNQSTSACIIYKNGSTTTMTCSLNGVTSCFDQPHSVAYSYGDTVTCAAIGGTSDTLAAVRCQFLTW